ncbi:MAG: hypothetical protein OXF86_12155, partial [Caldilineaceae bacterium]|nr:hypothetical protein [Caldilineaceae bacterium]
NTICGSKVRLTCAFTQGKIQFHDGVLRGPSWPFVDKKVFFATLRVTSRTKRCSSWPFMALRIQKGVLREPSRDFADEKVFFDTLVP